MMSPLLMFQQHILGTLFELFFLDRFGGFWFVVALFEGELVMLGKSAGSRGLGWPKVGVGTVFECLVVERPGSVEVGPD